LEKQMNKDMPQDLRTQTLAWSTRTSPPMPPTKVRALIGAWLGALDDEDLAGTARSLAPVLWDGFAQVPSARAGLPDRADALHRRALRHVDRAC
jgi:hypothetical protein